MTDAAALSNDATPSSGDDAVPPPPRKPFALPLPGLWVFLACVLIGLVCNAGGLRGTEYIGQEASLILNNDLLNRLPGLQAIWFRAASPSTYPLTQYAPLAQTLFFLEHAFWGGALWPYRLVSVLLHAGVGWMIWLLLRRLGVPLAIVTALLFVAHPTTVDSVSFLVERRTPLAALLGLASAFLLLRASGVIAPGEGKVKLLPDDPLRLFGMGALLFLLALCSNAALVATLPLVVLLVAWWKRGESAGRPDVRLTATCVVLLIAGVGMVSLSSTIEKARAGALSPAAWNRASTDAGELAVRTQIAGRAVAFYARKLVVPFPVSVDYPRWRTPRDVEQFRTFSTDPAVTAPLVTDVSPGAVVQYLFPLAVVVALVASWCLRRRFGRAQFVAVAGFVLLLAPSLGFIDFAWMRYTFVSNHAVYLASVPFIAGLATVVAMLLARAEDRTVSVSSAAIVLAIFVILSLNVSLRFKTAPYFWVRNVRAYPTFRSWWSRYELAASLLNEPDPSGFKQAKQAVDELRKYQPEEPAPLVMHGLQRQRELDELGAMKDFEQAMQTFPTYAPAYFEAADSFRVQAELHPRDPQPRLRAMQLFAQAAQLDPFDARSRVRLGQTAWEIARRLDSQNPDEAKYTNQYMDQAAEAFDQALQLRPYDVDLLVTIGRTLVDMRRLSDAGGLLESARTIAPDRADVYTVIADAALVLRDLTGADAALRAALENDPKYTPALLRLAALRESQERWTDARALLKRVQEIDADNAEAKRRLAEIDQAATTRPGT